MHRTHVTQPHTAQLPRLARLLHMYAPLPQHTQVVLAWPPGAMWWGDLITTPWVTVRNTDTPGVFSEYYNLAATPVRAAQRGAMYSGANPKQTN